MKSKYKNVIQVLESSKNKLFHCGCNKYGPYKRYNALYVHVKKKHQGIFPKGSFKK